MTAEKREEVLHFADVSATATPEYRAMNIGFNSADEALNAETASKQYIGQSTATTVITRMSPDISYNMNIEKADPVCAKVYAVHKGRATASTITIVNVFSFETATASGFPAFKGIYNVIPETGAFAGAGGEEIALTGKFSEVPDTRVAGWFDTVTRTFTEES